MDWKSTVVIVLIYVITLSIFAWAVITVVSGLVAYQNAQQEYQLQQIQEMLGK